MTVPGIHVHTQVDKSTVPYAQFMWETMLSLANRPESLKITIHCMGPTAAARCDSWVQQGKAIIVPNKRGDPLNGSYGHAACIMHAINEMGDGNVHVICDSDTVVVARGWDDYIRQRMVDDNIGMMGTTYEDLGGFSSGASSVQTYKKVPTFTWGVLSPRHDWRSLTVMPDKAHHVAINTPELSQIYNLPMGYTVFGEAGWQVPQYLHDNRLTYDGWQQLKPTKDAVVLKGLTDYHEEFHAQGIPFVVHHRGSMKHSYRGGRISKPFYEIVDHYLAQEKLRPPRWTWEDTGAAIGIPTFIDKPLPEPTAAPAIEVQPEAFTPAGKEWLKVSFNGKAIRTKRSVNRNVPGTALEFERPGPSSVGHLRVEGALEHTFPLVLPYTSTEPYLITCRNLSGSSLSVTCGKVRSVDMPHGATWWLLVDVDGVVRVE